MTEVETETEIENKEVERRDSDEDRVMDRVSLYNNVISNINSRGTR